MKKCGIIDKMTTFASEYHDEKGKQK